MNRPPFDASHSYGPGPAAVEARMRAVRAADRPNYAAITDALWEAAWEPRPPGWRGPLALALDAAAEYASQKQPARHSAVPTR